MQRHLQDSGTGQFAEDEEAARAVALEQWGEAVLVSGKHKNATYRSASRDWAYGKWLSDNKKSSKHLGLLDFLNFLVASGIVGPKRT